MPKEIWQARMRDGANVHRLLEGTDRGHIMREAGRWSICNACLTVETRQKPPIWWPFGGWRLVPTAPEHSLGMIALDDLAR